MINTIHYADGLDKQDTNKGKFYNRQLADTAVSINFALTNPKVLATLLGASTKNIATMAGSSEVDI